MRPAPFSIRSASLTLIAGALCAASCAISGAIIDPSLDALGGTAGVLSGAGADHGGTSNGDAGADGDTAGATSGGGTAGKPGTAAGAAGEETSAGAGGSGTAGAAGNTTSAGTGGSVGSAGTGGSVGSAGAGGSGTAGAGGSVGAAGAGGCPAGVLGHCDAGTTYPTYPGYTLALVEDFPAAMDLDTDPIFTWSDGAPSDGQTGFRKENLSFSGGKLVITADSTCAPKTSNSSCYPQRTSYSEALSPNKTANVTPMGVWSGELVSKYNNYRYGRYEVKFNAPIANPGQEGTDNLSGDYLTTMFVFRTPKNVVWNEIDVEVAPWHHNHVAGNVVSATGSSAYPAANASAWDVVGPVGYQITQSHVYAFTWTPTSIDWYLDGVAIRSFAGTTSVPIPTQSAKIMLNLWVFNGAIFGDPVNNKYPFKAEYDYFRFYKLGTEVKYPCSPTPACLAAADKTSSAQNNPNELNYGQ